MQTLEELIVRNEKDKHALDLIKCYLDYVGNCNDIQNRLIEAGVPVDSKAFRLMDEQKDAFKSLWLSVAEKVSMKELSTDVWYRFFKLRHDVKFNS